MKGLKIICVFLLLLFLINTTYSSVYANDYIDETNSVVDSELRNILIESDPNDKIPVDIWFYNTDSIENLENEIDSLIGINKEKIVNSDTKALSDDKIDEYIITERTLYVERTLQFYEEFLNDYKDISALHKTQEDQRLFFSRYAPLINTELTPEEINLLATDKRVQSMYYSPYVEAIEETNHTIPLIRADYTRDTLGCSGNGIKIGMIEAKYLPDSSLPCFSDATIIYEQGLPVVFDTTYYHPDIVAAIMVGNEAENEHHISYNEGIVPDATLYATYCEYANDDWRKRIEWLLDQGVHVINMSAGFNTGSGNYGTLEKWVDHIAINHSVHFVKSAGNSDNVNQGKVTSPGMAYNIITVGSMNDKNSTTQSDDIWADSSAYIEVEGTNKPDLVAPGVGIRTFPGTDSGTSFAAPHVTAVVAQLCQRNPSLKVLQDGMKAILTASISHSILAYDTSSTYYNKCGAGLVDARAAFYTSDYDRYVTSVFAANSASGSIKSYPIYVSSSDSKIRVSLTWLRYVVLSGTHYSASPSTYSLANLNLYIYGPDGSLVKSSTKPYWNTEVVDFNPQLYGTGTYTIVVKQQFSSDQTVYFGLAWW